MFAMGPAFFEQAAGGYATLAITGDFAPATQGIAYSSSLPIAGGLEPYSLTGGTGVASGSLDSGFALSITGTTGARYLTLACASPATADTMTFTASVDSTDGQTATSAQSVTVSNVVLDLRMTGADGGTSFTDHGPYAFTVTPSGDAHTQTTGVPSGGSGGSATYFDGTGDWLSLPSNAAIYGFGTGDFSIEVEVYADATSLEQVIFGCEITWPGTVGYLLEIRAGGDLRFYAGDGLPIAIIGGAGSLSATTWHTVRVERISGTTTLKLDGSTVGTPHTGTVSINGSSGPRVGTFPQDGSTCWKGWMRNLKVTKG